MSWNQSDVAMLEQVAAEKTRLAALERATVAHLRQQECPWSVIAEALGVSKQAAHHKFSSQRVSLVDRPMPPDATGDK